MIIFSLFVHKFNLHTAQLIAAFRVCVCFFNYFHDLFVTDYIRSPDRADCRLP